MTAFEVTSGPSIDSIKRNKRIVFGLKEFGKVTKKVASVSKITEMRDGVYEIDLTCGMTICYIAEDKSGFVLA
jgi:predicted choloylglycine hydrolase